jgi:phosphatidate cytidylyltransferase
VTNLATRSITGFFFVLAIVSATWFGPWSFIVLLLALATGTLLEFYRITTTETQHPQRGMGTALGLLLLAFFSYNAQQVARFDFGTDLAILFKAPVVLLALVYLSFFIEIFRRREAPFVNIGLTLLGMFFIAIPFSLFGMIGLSENEGAYDPQLALGFLVLLWFADSGAYAVGKRFGRHKLIERISPGKTWEGAAGGLLISLAAAWAWSRFFHRLDLPQWLGLAAVVFATGLLGDLLASLLKRSLGLKDSGRFFPGHGGFLDRFDGLLGAAPFAYLYLYLLGKL